MLSNEIELFNNSYELFSKTRNESINELFRQFNGGPTKPPQENKIKVKKTNQKQKLTKSKEEKEVSKMVEEKETIKKQSKEESYTKKVKFLQDTPQFVGPELKTHGPFEKGQETKLPQEIHSVLLKQGKIEEI